MNRYFNEDATLPLPPQKRAPLVLVIDTQTVRRLWVSNLLSYANYHTHSALSPRESFIWYIEHQMFVHGVLLGDISPQEHFIVQRLLLRIVSHQQAEVPTISLAAYLPDETRIGSLPFPSRTQGGVALLEALWLNVMRK
jgi:hypothetical protein